MNELKELTQEVEGYRWYYLSISESWRPKTKDIFMGAGEFENNHGLGILLSKKRRKRINWTDYINERVIATSIKVREQRVLFMSMFLLHSGYADHHVERAYRAIEAHTKSKRSIQIVGGDLNAPLGPGIGVEQVGVGPHTLKEGNKRGDWMNQWLILKNS